MKFYIAFSLTSLNWEGRDTLGNDLPPDFYIWHHLYLNISPEMVKEIQFPSQNLG